MNATEVERVKLKAIEQARQARQASKLTRPSPDSLLPVAHWPFRLTQDDIAFLRNCPYPISPA